MGVTFGKGEVQTQCRCLGDLVGPQVDVLAELSPNRTVEPVRSGAVFTRLRANLFSFHISSVEPLAFGLLYGHGIK